MRPRAAPALISADLILVVDTVCAVGDARYLPVYPDAVAARLYALPMDSYRAEKGVDFVLKTMPNASRTRMRFGVAACAMPMAIKYMYKENVRNRI